MFDERSIFGLQIRLIRNFKRPITCTGSSSCVVVFVCVVADDVAAAGSGAGSGAGAVCI